MDIWGLLKLKIRLSAIKDLLLGWINMQNRTTEKTFKQALLQEIKLMGLCKAGNVQSTRGQAGQAELWLSPEQHLNMQKVQGPS